MISEYNRNKVQYKFSFSKSFHKVSMKPRINVFRCPENQPFDTRAKTSNYYRDILLEASGGGWMDVQAAGVVVGGHR